MVNSQSPFLLSFRFWARPRRSHISQHTHHITDKHKFWNCNPAFLYKGEIQMPTLGRSLSTQEDRNITEQFALMETKCSLQHWALSRFYTSEKYSVPISPHFIHTDCESSILDDQYHIFQTWRRYPQSWLTDDTSKWNTARCRNTRKEKKSESKLMPVHR